MVYTYIPITKIEKKGSISGLFFLSSATFFIVIYWERSL